MGKFIKSVIDKAKATKSALKLKTAMKGQQGIYTFFSIWFYCIDQYASKNPSAMARTIMKIYLIPFTPGDWTCDDKGFIGVTAKQRLKLIKYNYAKDKVVKDKDVLWLKNELRPAFEKDLKQKGLDIDSVLLDLPEEKIAGKLKALKQDKKYKEMLK